MNVPIVSNDTLVILDEVLKKFQELLLETNINYFIEDTAEPPTESYCTPEALDLNRVLYGSPSVKNQRSESPEKEEEKRRREKNTIIIPPPSLSSNDHLDMYWILDNFF